MQKIVDTITENSTIEGKSSIEFDENVQLFFAHNNYFSLQNIFPSACFSSTVTLKPRAVDTRRRVASIHILILMRRKSSVMLPHAVWFLY